MGIGQQDGQGVQGADKGCLSFVGEEDFSKDGEGKTEGGKCFR